jgi:DNA helicase HerA-like ATPase
MTDVDPVAAAKKALEDAQAALAAAEAQAAAVTPPAPTVAAPEPTAAAPAPSSASVPPPGPLNADQVDAIRAGYSFDAPALEMGALVNGVAMPDVPIRIPIAMVNRHGLVAGATGTGKTKTLQVLAEQLAAAGVPVFAADIKGDLSGIASPGTESPQLIDRTNGIGQKWSALSSPVEYFSLGGVGTGIPLRASVKGFGYLLLSKVLGLNPTQESSLGLVFHYADQAQPPLPLVDLSDLRAVLMYLVSDAGKGELDSLGGLSKATAGVILRELITFSDQGADVFFGEPAIDVQKFLRMAPDGVRGLVSLMEVPGVQDKPELFSTFLMWLLTELYDAMPEVGDLPKPKLVFFFDEAHLLFNGASKDFLQVITQTVRLIRSKGVGIFFVTQTPKDVPGDVLAQLGSRVQHQLRAHTPDDARALKATVSTYPTSGYDLAQVLQNLATGEAIVTVMNEKGAPSPVAWTRLRAPQSSMSPTPADQMAAAVAASPLLAEYGTPLDPVSARDILEQKAQAAVQATQAAAAAAGVPVQPAGQAGVSAQQRQLDAQIARAQKAAAAQAARDAKAQQVAADRAARQKAAADERLRKEAVGAGVSIAKKLIGAFFGSTRR